VVLQLAGRSRSPTVGATWPVGLWPTTAAICEMILSTEQSDEHLEKIAQEAVEEARMVLPGIQALFGFQLIAVFNESFRRLDAAHQYLHFAAIVLIAISIGLIMAPAAYHRQVESGSVSRFFVELASGLIMAAMVPLMISICIEVYIVGHLVLANGVLSMLVAGALFAGFVFGWFVFPYLARRRWRES
jgi:hypothetical protein